LYSRPRLTEFEPHITKAAKKETKDEESTEEDKFPKIEIVELYKINSQLYPFFEVDQ
jgi:hypothetical protein